MSNFPCSLTRNIASHSMENLAFHSLLRWVAFALHLPSWTCSEPGQASWLVCRRNRAICWPKGLGKEFRQSWISLIELWWPGPWFPCNRLSRKHTLYRCFVCLSDLDDCMKTPLVRSERILTTGARRGNRKRWLFRWKSPNRCFVTKHRVDCKEGHLRTPSSNLCWLLRDFIGMFYGRPWESLALSLRTFCSPGMRGSLSTWDCLLFPPPTRWDTPEAMAGTHAHLLSFPISGGNTSFYYTASLATYGDST